MCLVIRNNTLFRRDTPKRFKSNEDAKSFEPTIAKKDIKVYKLLVKYECTSPHRNERYWRGDTKRVTLGKVVVLFKKSEYRVMVEEGMHAYTTRKSADCDYARSSCYVHEMVVPKGSKYYLGIHGDIVSDTLHWPK